MCPKQTDKQTNLIPHITTGDNKKAKETSQNLHVVNAYEYPKGKVRLGMSLYWNHLFRASTLLF